MHIVLYSNTHLSVTTSHIHRYNHNLRHCSTRLSQADSTRSCHHSTLYTHPTHENPQKCQIKYLNFMCQLISSSLLGVRPRDRWPAQGLLPRIGLCLAGRRQRQRSGSCHTQKRLIWHTKKISRKNKLGVCLRRGGRRHSGGKSKEDSGQGNFDVISAPNSLSIKLSCYYY